MKPETIKRLIDSGMTSDELLAAMQQHQAAKRTMESIERDRRELARIYKAKLESLDKAELAVRSECMHYEVEYHPDPSGNNDSCYRCELCGKESRKRNKLGGFWLKDLG